MEKHSLEQEFIPKMVDYSYIESPYQTFLKTWFWRFVLLYFLKREVDFVLLPLPCFPGLRALLCVRMFGIMFWKSVSRWCVVVISQLGRALPWVQRPCCHTYSSSAASASLPTLSPSILSNPWAFCTNSDLFLVMHLHNTLNITPSFFGIEYWAPIMSAILSSFVTVVHFFSSLQHLTKKIV